MRFTREGQLPSAVRFFSCDICKCVIIDRGDALMIHMGWHKDVIKLADGIVEQRGDWSNILDRIEGGE